MFQKIQAAWCRAFHGSPMHPILGIYRCRKCQRTFLVPWGEV